MPPGLQAVISKRELRDVIEYLAREGTKVAAYFSATRKTRRFSASIMKTFWRRHREHGRNCSPTNSLTRSGNVPFSASHCSRASFSTSRLSLGSVLISLRVMSHLRIIPTDQSRHAGVGCTTSSGCLALTVSPPLHHFRLNRVVASLRVGRRGRFVMGLSVCGPDRPPPH